MEIFEVSPGLFIWSALTFVLLVALLYKFAFGPLMELQQQRQDEIHESIREAERLREEARQLLSDYQEQLAKARHESEEILSGLAKWERAPGTRCWRKPRIRRNGHWRNRVSRFKERPARPSGRSRRRWRISLWPLPRR